MKAYIAARGLDEIECPVCGSPLNSRIARCPKFESADEKQRCQWQPGFWANSRFWSTTPTEVDLSPDEISQLKKFPDLMVIDEKMFATGKQSK